MRKSATDQLWQLKITLMGTNARPTPRWYQISLRRLLLFTAAVAVCLGWLRFEWLRGVTPGRDGASVLLGPLYFLLHPAPENTRDGILLTGLLLADPKAVILAPFSSLAELIALRRSVAKFGKRKYPPGMKPFKIRSPLEETAIWLRLYAAWLFFSPLVLLFQTLPTTEMESRIVM